jgi:DNA repair protein RAD50
MSCESSIHRLKDEDIPSLEEQIHAQDELLPPLTEAAEKVSHLTYLRLIYLTCMWQANDKLQVLKRELKELLSLRQHAVNVSRLHSDCKDLRKEISNVEKSLAVTGSKKTADDVQQELDELSAALCVPFIHACCRSTHHVLQAKLRKREAEPSERSRTPE